MKLISTKDITKRFNLTYQTLNYYTNIGLFNVVSRKGNKRMYNEDEVADKTRDIENLKNEGYPLRLIVRKLNGEKAI